MGSKHRGSVRYLRALSALLMVTVLSLTSVLVKSAPFSVHIVYGEKKSIAEAVYDRYIVTEDGAGWGGPSAFFSESLDENGWKHSIQVLHYGVSEAEFEFTIERAYAVPLRLFLNISNPPPSWYHYLTVLINGSQVAFYNSSGTYNLTFYPRGGSLRVRAAVGIPSYESNDYANITVWVGDLIMAAWEKDINASVITYTVYPNSTDYNITISYGSYTIVNATMTLPPNTFILYSHPNYTGRNDTAVWWYNVNVGVIEVWVRELSPGNETMTAPSNETTPAYKIRRETKTMVSWNVLLLFMFMILSMQMMFLALIAGKRRTSNTVFTI